MSLSDDDIVTTRVSARRSFLAKVGAVLIGSSAMVLGAGSASGVDSDRGRPADSKVSDNDKKDRRADRDKRESGDPKTKPSKDTDRGRPADAKLSDSDKKDRRADHDKRQPGDPK